MSKKKVDGLQAAIKTVEQAERAKAMVSLGLTPHFCIQCNTDMGNEWILGPVCGECVRANHRRVVGR